MTRPTSPPPVPPPSIRVLAAVIAQQDRVLLGCRPAHKRHGNLWEFPGGKVEPGETDFDAMARELREELGVQLVSLGAERCVARDGASPYEIVFVDVTVRGTPQALEHSALAWVPVSSLGEYALAPSDVVCAEVLRQFAA
jgi:mutator protein MutT